MLELLVVAAMITTPITIDTIPEPVYILSERMDVIYKYDYIPHGAALVTSPVLPCALPACNECGQRIQ